MSAPEAGWIIPPALSPGSTVRVVAPSSPFDVRLVWRGLGWLSQRYRVRFDRGIFSRRGYLAGDDERRRSELCAALEEPGVDAIVCARGGYGISRYAHQVEWSLLRRRPRWIVGFSDVTTLHVEAASVRVASLHACHVTALGRSDARCRDALLDVLERPAVPRTLKGLESWRDGGAHGRLVGGNLALLHACAAAGRLRLPPQGVLLIEDIGERPYRIDRMLTTLVTGGHLATVAAVLVGDFIDCETAPDGTSVEQVLRERLSLLGVPVVAGAPVGHGPQNVPMVLGAPTRVTAAHGEGRVDFFPVSSGSSPDGSSRDGSLGCSLTRG